MNFLFKAFGWVPRLFKWGSRSAEGVEELRSSVQAGSALSKEDTAAATLAKKWGAKPKAEPIQESPASRPQPRVDVSAPSAPNRGALRSLLTGGGGLMLGGGGVYALLKDAPQTFLATFTSWDGPGVFGDVTRAIRAQHTIGQESEAKQKAVQAGALTDHAPLGRDVDARLRAKGIVPNSP
jgi:hypothetical protein